MLNKTLLALSLVALSGSAISAPVANIYVQGKITPPTCQVLGADETDLVYNYNIAPGSFPASGDYTLPEQKKTVTVTCDAITRLSFSLTDNRPDTESVTGTNNFGLGMYGTDKVGYYKINFSNPKIKNNEAAEFTTSYLQTSATANGAVSAVGTKNGKLQFGYGTDARYNLGVAFQTDVAVTPTINGAMKNSDGTAELDGHAVMAFAFGI